MNQFDTPVLLQGVTWWDVLGTPAVPLGPAADMSGEALPDTGLEVVSWISVARMQGMVQLLNLRQSDPPVMAWSHVWFDFIHQQGEGWCCSEEEVVWIMNEDEVVELFV